MRKFDWRCSLVYHESTHEFQGRRTPGITVNIDIAITVNGEAINSKADRKPFVEIILKLFILG
jgi:hypothetical protein